MKIAVAGTGYVGLVTGVCLAEHGHAVVSVDIDEQKLAALQSGVCPIFEPGLAELMHKNRERLIFTADGPAAYREADIIFITVATPEKRDGSANLTYVYDAARTIARSVRKNTVVAVKSTVPIGTNDRLDALINRDLSGIAVEVVSNPEFLAQGTAVRDTMHAARIVVGVKNRETGEFMRDLYKPFNAPLLITDRKSAEMVKYASNDFLALKISYINEIANLCEIIGADIDAVSRGMGLDPRIGNQFLQAGIGYGGSCFPKDTAALYFLADYYDYELKTIKAAIEVNKSQKLKPLKKARKYYASLAGRQITVLGLTFKPGTDDLREAPSLVNIPVLLEEQALIRAWDPAGSDNFRRLYPEGIEYCRTIDEALTGSELCFIFTEWPQILAYDLNSFPKLMRRPVVIDGRNCFSPQAARAAGIIYDSVGRVGPADGSQNLNGETGALR
ncbi:MAG: UDP-glucose/GDP-mannose dehydrogenase family protein [Gracilibacteraceae bacterium]|jgi:UDPglucose 6-dehydrogenase|nr:UDP-glucose/GDP-mannose dehydrogenase family protein [Gracilibacteraceae bacterium]